MTLRQSSNSFSGRLQLHRDQKSMTVWSNGKSMLVCFLTMKALYIRHKHPDSGATTAAPCIMTMFQFTHHTFCSSFLASKKATVIPHPPYSPDLTTCNFFLLPKMKLKLKGRRFESSEKIQTKSQGMMKTLIHIYFQQCFQSWKSHWNRCINAEGDYFQRDGGE